MERSPRSAERKRSRKEVQEKTAESLPGGWTGLTPKARSVLPAAVYEVPLWPGASADEWTHSPTFLSPSCVPLSPHTPSGGVRTMPLVAGG